MQWLPQHVSNRLGRRLLVIFVVTALLPVAVMAGLSFSQISDTMHAQHDARLTESARAYGDAVYDRMRWVESLVAVGASGGTAAASLSARVGKELDGFVVLDRKDMPMAKAGQAPPHAQLAALPEGNANDQRRSALLSWPTTNGPASGQDIEDIPTLNDLSNAGKMEAIRRATKAFSREEFTRLLFDCHSILRDNHKMEAGRAFDEISKILFIKMYIERTGDHGKFTVNYLDQYARIRRRNIDDVMNDLFEDTKQYYRIDELFGNTPVKRGQLAHC